MPYFPCTNNVFLCTMPLPPQAKIKFLKVHPLMETSKRVLETFHSPTWIKTNKNTTEKQYRLDYCRYIFGWNIKRELLLQYPSTIPALGAPSPGGGGRLLRRISSDGDDQTGAKPKTSKNSLDQKKNQKLPNGISKPQHFPENWYNTKNTKKNPYLNQATPKKYLPNFPTLKNLRIENFKPPKLLQSFLSHEIRITSPGLPVYGRRW